MPSQILAAFSAAEDKGFYPFRLSHSTSEHSFAALYIFRALNFKQFPTKVTASGFI
jgi:hypothetical protein